MWGVGLGASEWGRGWAQWRQGPAGHSSVGEGLGAGGQTPGEGGEGLAPTEVVGRGVGAGEPRPDVLVSFVEERGKKVPMSSSQGCRHHPERRVPAPRRPVPAGPSPAPRGSLQELPSQPLPRAGSARFALSAVLPNYPPSLFQGGFSCRGSSALGSVTPQIFPMNQQQSRRELNSRSRAPPGLFGPGTEIKIFS